MPPQIGTPARHEHGRSRRRVRGESLREAGVEDFERDCRPTRLGRGEMARSMYQLPILVAATLVAAATAVLPAQASDVSPVALPAAGELSPGDSSC